jgi:hypothetical protein
MSRIAVFLFTAAVFFSSSPGSALYNGNPSEPRLIENGVIWKKGKVGVKAGYEGDFMYDRDLNIDRFKYFINQGVLSLNVKRRVEVYGSLGEMRANFDQKGREYRTDHHLTWGVGARGILFRKRTTTLGMDGAYQMAHLHIRGNSAKLKYQDWQVGLGIAHQVDILTPYLALTCSGMRGKMTEPALRLRNRHWIGFALGCSFCSGQCFDVNVEARVLDEQAFSLAANLKF